MAGFIAMDENRECRPLQGDDFPSNGGGGGGGVRITASVGIGGANLSADVRTIQQALNDVPANQGQPIPLLVVDGMCGPKTKNAIQQFQLKHFGWPGADGRVDPDKQTIAKLNELTGGSRARPLGGDASASGPSTPEEEAARVSRIILSINEALRCVKAAQMNLTIALRSVDEPPNTPSPFPSMGREERMRLANRHFDIDRYPSFQRRRVLGEVRYIYDLMLQVFTRPGNLWGPWVFAADPLAHKSIAFTYGGGFFTSGEKTIEKGITLRTDTIYLCKKLDKQTDEMQIVAIIHEMAHFVSRLDEIVDHAYGWHDRPRMQRLTPGQKKNNAQNYCNLAFDAVHSRKPHGL